MPEKTQKFRNKSKNVVNFVLQCDHVLSKENGAIQTPSQQDDLTWTEEIL